MRVGLMRKRAWRVQVCGSVGLALIMPCAAIAQQRAPAQGAVSAQQSASARQRMPARQSVPARAMQPGPSAAAARPAERADDPEPAVDTSPKAKGKAMDHLQLGTTDITGNRELPKVMYIVPWKHSELGDLTGKPLNSLIDQTLQPVDRDVFRRETEYYRAVAASRGATSGAAHPAGSGAAGDSARSAASGDGQPVRDER